MSKQGVYKITGDPSPKVGEKTIYTITAWYPATPKEKRNPALVTWELFKKRSDGKFTTTDIKKKGDGSFTFGEVSQKHTYLLEAYLHHPEGKTPMALEINPQLNEVPKIGKVELHYADNTKGSIFSFTEKLVAKAHCVNMRGRKLNFMLWEDDAKGEGHSAKNLLIDSKQGYVEKNGLATVEFMLTKALMKKAMQGEIDPKELEFYITVEYYRNKKHSSDNVDVNNPLSFEFPQKPKPVPPEKPATAKGSPAEQKPPSQKEEKGIVDKAIDTWNELWDWAESKGTVKKDKKPTQQKPEGRSVSVVENQERKKDESCICKEQYKDLVWGGKIGCNERKKVIEVANNLEIDPNWLMTVMALETAETFRPSIDNGIGYVGLIQFGKDAAKDVGTTQDALVKMSFVEQMNYVEKHLNKKKSKYKTLVDLYLAVLYPSASGHGSEPNYVVLRETAYKNNPLFFKEEDEYIEKIRKGKKTKVRHAKDGGVTYVWEVDLVAKEVYIKGQGFKIKEFSCGIEKTESLPNGKCPDDYSQCFDYFDVVDYPLVNDQSGNKNHNRYKNEARTKSNGEKYFHQGTDILASVGTKVYSALCGKVVHLRSDLPQNNYSKGYENATSYGNTITIESIDKAGQLVYLFYAHLSKINVEVGDKVRHGKLIGLSGSTGNAMHVDVKYRHVHVEAGTNYQTYGGNNGKLKSKLSNRINPEDYMKTKFDEKGNKVK